MQKADENVGLPKKRSGRFPHRAGNFVDKDGQTLRLPFRQARALFVVSRRIYNRCMTAAKRLKLVSPDDYLAGELASTTKHEYLGGVIYAMAGATNAHNLISTNVAAALHTRLRGRPCRAFNSDTKIRLRVGGQTRFYYPDASVVCTPNPPTDSFQDEPVVVVEVMSASTRRLDEGEKRDAYLTLASLSNLILIEQDAPAAVVYRRAAEGFVRQAYEGLAAVVPLDEIGVSLPLADGYEAVDLPASFQSVTDLD